MKRGRALKVLFLIFAFFSFTSIVWAQSSCKVSGEVANGETKNFTVNGIQFSLGHNGGYQDGAGSYPFIYLNHEFIYNHLHEGEFLKHNLAVISFEYGPDYNITFCLNEPSFPCSNCQSLVVESIEPVSGCLDEDLKEGYPASYYTSSLVKWGNGKKSEDRCNYEGGLGLQEAVCMTNGDVMFKDYNCTYGCKNGACVAEEEFNCTFYYWMDDTRKNCGYKQFCGLFRYSGLKTFDTVEECYAQASYQTCSNQGEDCSEIACCENLTCGNSGKCVVKENKCELKNNRCCLGDVCDDGYSGGISPQRLECPENSEYEFKCSSSCSLTLNCVKNLSNGRKAEIKIMPETASARAIERLGEIGFNVTLKESGNVRLVYELTGNKEGRLLGIFKVIARVSAEIDAETGEVKIIKPWWSFFAGI